QTRYQHQHSQSTHVVLEMRRTSRSGRVPTPQLCVSQVWQEGALGQGAYTLKDSENDEGEEEMLHALVAHSSSNRDIVRPIEQVLLWEDRKLRMLVDTGSPVSVIPKSVLKRHRKWWPALERTPLRLSCFLGPVPVLGRIFMRVQHGQALVRSVLVVVDCEGPLLWGRNTIQAFQDVGASLLKVEMPFHVDVLRGDAPVQRLLEEFADVFKKKLGCCEGPPVKLYSFTGGARCPRIAKSSFRRSAGSALCKVFFRARPYPVSFCTPMRQCACLAFLVIAK
ncbi:hypothetical protein HPB47_027615, partial [Ixodes persulcatus]